LTCTVFEHVLKTLMVTIFLSSHTSDLLTLHCCRFVLDGVARMRERPIQDLVDGLVQLGVDAKCTLGTGCPPVAIDAKGMTGGKVAFLCACDEILYVLFIYCLPPQMHMLTQFEPTGSTQTT
jgi:hypothetical protein